MEKILENLNNHMREYFQYEKYEEEIKNEVNIILNDFESFCEIKKGFIDLSSFFRYKNVKPASKKQKVFILNTVIFPIVKKEMERAFFNDFDCDTKMMNEKEYLSFILKIRRFNCSVLSFDKLQGMLELEDDVYHDFCKKVVSIFFEDSELHDNFEEHYFNTIKLIFNSLFLDDLDDNIYYIIRHNYDNVSIVKKFIEKINNFKSLVAIFAILNLLKFLPYNDYQIEMFNYDKKEMLKYFLEIVFNEYQNDFEFNFIKQKLTEIEDAENKLFLDVLSEIDNKECKKFYLNIVL